MSNDAACNKNNRTCIERMSLTITEQTWRKVCHNSGFNRLPSLPYPAIPVCAIASCSRRAWEKIFQEIFVYTQSQYSQVSSSTRHLITGTVKQNHSVSNFILNGTRY